MGDKNTLYKVHPSDVKVTKPYDRQAALAAAKQAAADRGGLGRDEDILPLPKGSEPPGEGFRKIPSRSPDFDIYYRKRGAGGTDSGAGSGPGQLGEPTGAPPDGGAPGSNGTSPGSTAPGVGQVEDVEQNFSDDKDADGTCVKCMVRGASKGAAIASAVALGLTLLSLVLPGAWLARIAGALLGLAIAGVIKLAKNWKNMSSEERQEAGAELVAGVVVGLGGTALTPGTGAPAPEGGVGPSPVAVTPDGIPVRVPDAEPGASSDPMQMSAPEDGGGGGDDQAGEAPKKKLSAKERRARDQQRTAEEKFQKRGETNNISPNNQTQNEDFEQAAEGLSKDERQELHRAVSKQNFSKEQIIKERNTMFPNNPYPGKQ